MIDIRRIGTDYAEQLANLQADTFRQAYSDTHASEDIETYCLTHYTTEIAKMDLSSEATACCMGWLDSKLSGYYIVKHRACPIALDAKSSELKQIYVLSSSYGRGLGRALFDHAIATVYASGSEWVWLCVSDMNYRAQAFYKKLKFNKLGPGAVLKVGNDKLSSSILAKDLRDLSFDQNAVKESNDDS
ncbi:MAG: GNAT family N-acetyltransferase [Cyanobacteria bacterium P01_F01_bin.86]